MHGGGRGLHKKFEFGRLCLVRDWKDGKMVGKEGRDELWMEGMGWKINEAADSLRNCACPTCIRVDAQLSWEIMIRISLGLVEQDRSV